MFSMSRDFGVVVLISGRGSNLKVLIERAEHYKILAVISDNPEAPGLAYAKEASIPIHTFSKGDFSSKDELKRAIFEKAVELDPQLVALAGFMQIIPEYFVERFYGRLINIHPSLLPKFPGLNTHRRVIEAGDTFHGCTVHFVDKGVDTGPIIAHLGCVRWTPDTEEILAERVLVLEHKLYPWVVNLIAQDLIWLEDKSTRYDTTAVLSANHKGIYIGQK